jgi:hypothetical protein
MANPDMNPAEQDRVSRGQSIAKGDTGDGETGVPAQEPGISNRPGDRGVADPEPVIERDEASGVDDDDEGDSDPDAGGAMSDDLEPEPDRA